MDQDLRSYIVNGSLAATLDGPTIDLRSSDRTLAIFLQTTATGTPNGLLSLQGSIDGATWRDLPGAFSQLPGSTPAALAAQDRVCIWSVLTVPYVRLRYTRTSGGTGATINAQAYVR